MGTAIKNFVPDRVKPSLVIFDIQALWRSGLSVRVPGCQSYKWWLNPVWHGCIMAVPIWPQWCQRVKAIQQVQAAIVGDTRLWHGVESVV